jgi:hypothetical protein
MARSAQQFRFTNHLLPSLFSRAFVSLENRTMLVADCGYDADRATALLPSDALQPHPELGVPELFQYLAGSGREAEV